MLLRLLSLFCLILVLLAGMACLQQKAPDNVPATDPEAAPEPAEEPATAPAPEPEPITITLAAPAALPADTEKLAEQAYSTGAKASEGQASGGRTKIKQLFSFEDSDTFDIDGKKIPYFEKQTENLDLVYVMDNGVTDGRWCARATVPAGVAWSTIMIRDKEMLKNWSDYDYFAVDLWIEDDHPYRFVFELWDHDSTNYPTRCTNESYKMRNGKQTIMWPINRAKRNNKEGREWNELEPKDKIDLDNLKMVKIFTTPRKDRRMQFWIDNIRLLQEDAAKPKMAIPLPATAQAFDFGSPGACVEGFTATDTAQFTGKGVNQSGTGWPDLLAGTFIQGAFNEPLTWEAPVPDGAYRYWLCAGKILNDQYRNPYYKLVLNGQAIIDDKPSFAEYDSPGYVHRFMWTQYSERKHAAWLDYINTMYETHTGTVNITGGKVQLEAVNHMLSGLLLVPENDKEDFERAVAKITMERIKMFERLSLVKDKEKSGAQGVDVFVPEYEAAIMPGTPAKAGPLKLTGKAAQGQNLMLRLGVRPGSDAGKCELQLSDLTGDAGSISMNAIEGYLKNYRFGERSPSEMILLPTLGFNGEAGITQSIWLWLNVPEDAAAGIYTADFTLRTENSVDQNIPVEVEVYPFKLRRDIPVSYGMYGGAEGKPQPPSNFWEQMEIRYKWMYKAGFTATRLPVSISATGINENEKTVNMKMSEGGLAALKASGLGSAPGQYQMTTQLGLARRISRFLQPAVDSAGAPVDKNPGIEFTHPDFKAYWIDAHKKVKPFLDSLDIPYAIEIVDEPREVPNPWNRNYADTCRYGDWMKEAGYTTRFVTPMSNGSNGIDYSGLINHTDIMSIHAGAGSNKHEDGAKAQGKDLWYYNTSKDRFGWGFYAWAKEVTGRWEWHWMWNETPSKGKYPGRESFSPFSGQNGYNLPAPWADNRGGFLSKTSMFRIADGITDRLYVYTLEELLKEKAGHAAASEATALLETIKAGIPMWPHNDAYHKAAHHADEWRAQIAEAIIKLMSE